MESEQSHLEERELRESTRLHAVQENGREGQYQERSRSEGETDHHTPDEDLKSLEAEHLQEAIRRSIADTQGQLCQGIDNGDGSSRNDSNQTAAAATAAATAAPNLAGSHYNERKDESMLCKTCKKPYGEHIFQCNSGHSSCKTCRIIGLPCGLCRGPITNKRNFDLENFFAANQRVKCPNAIEGCTLTFKKSDLLVHVEVCLFRELKCPALVHCNWKGKISQLSIHFDEKHPSSRQANVNTEMFLPNICNEYDSLQLIKIGIYNFLFYVKISENERKIYIDTQLIGTKENASKWTYEIHVYNKSEPRRKYQYNSSCSSSEDTPGGISLRNCAILPLSYAITFIDEGTLSYKFFIKKEKRCY